MESPYASASNAGSNDGRALSQDSNGVQHTSRNVDGEEKKRRIEVFFRNKYISIDQKPSLKLKVKNMLSKHNKESSKVINPSGQTLLSSKSTN